MTATQTKALVPIENFTIAPIENETAYNELLNELNGLGGVSFPRIKIPNGGVVQFEVIMDEDIESEYQNEITGIIIHHHPMYSYWRDAYNPSSTTPPDCASMDGETGVLAATGEAFKCDTCKYNQHGSGVGNSKACKNGHRLYILPDGEPLPMVLSLPPTSLRSMNAYITDLMLRKKRKAHTVVTRIKLAKPSKDSTYSRVQFSIAGVLPDDMAEGVTRYAEPFKASAVNATVQMDDYDRPVSANEPPSGGAYPDSYSESFADYTIPDEQ